MAILTASTFIKSSIWDRLKRSIDKNMRCSWIAFLVVCCACDIQNHCDNSKAVAIIKEHINADSLFSDNFKEIEIKRKDKLFKEACTIENGLRNFILFEKEASRPGEYLGIIYNYADGMLYSYGQDADKVQIEEGNRFDRYGALSRILYSMKTDVVHDMDSLVQRAAENRITDWTPIYIYYINIDSNKQKYAALR